MWDGKSNKEENNKNKKNNGNNGVKVTQPISNLKSPVPTHQISRADYLNTHKDKYKEWFD